MGRARHVILLTAAVLAAAGPPVAAAPPETPVRWLHLFKVDGKAYVEGRLEREQQTGAGTRTDEQEYYFEEGVELKTTGYFYHPNFLDWSAAVRLGLMQDRFTINGEDSHTDGRLLGYNFSGLLLKEAPFSARLFAARSQDFRSRDFARSLRVDQQATGLELLRPGVVPMSLLLEWLERHETSDLRDLDSRTGHLRFSLADQRNPDRLTRLTYDHKNTEETVRFVSPGTGASSAQKLPDRSDELLLSNQWKFGPADHPHSLSGRVRALSRRGFFENDLLLLEERLELRHSPTFLTFYRGLFSYDRTDLQRNRTVSGETGFTKKFYDSLELTARLTARDSELLDGGEQVYGASINAAYRKKTPLGRYSSSLLLGKEYERETSRGGQRFVSNEPVSLTATAFKALAQPQVVSGSVTVTDADNLLTYVEGVDYRLRTTGAFTEITRLVGGDIDENQLVLVDYLAVVARDAEFLTDVLSWQNRLDLEQLPLSFYANYRLRDERLHSGMDPGNLDTLRGLVLGAELNWQRLTLTYEHEIVRQELFPSSTADRLRASWHRPLSDRMDLALGAHAEALRYDNADAFGLAAGQDYLHSLGGYGRVNVKLSPTALLRLSTEALRTDGRERRRLIRNRVGVDWMHRKLKFSLTASYDIYQQERNEGDSVGVMFTVSRSF